MYPDVGFLTSSGAKPDHYRVKRRPLPDLSHVLEDRRPLTMTAMPVGVTQEKRTHIRFDKAFVVVIGSELYGDSVAIGRNLSSGGLLVEMSYAPPLGTVVTVHFQYQREGDVVDEIIARAEVKHHHYLNFTGSRGWDDAASTRAIGMRFVEFLDPGDRVEADRIQ
jgi:hypothetical protein